MGIESIGIHNVRSIRTVGGIHSTYSAGEILAQKRTGPYSKDSYPGDSRIHFRIPDLFLAPSIKRVSNAFYASSGDILGRDLNPYAGIGTSVVYLLPEGRRHVLGMADSKGNEASRRVYESVAALLDRFFSIEALEAYKPPDGIIGGEYSKIMKYLANNSNSLESLKKSYSQQVSKNCEGAGHAFKLLQKAVEIYKTIPLNDKEQLWDTEDLTTEQREAKKLVEDLFATTTNIFAFRPEALEELIDPGLFSLTKDQARLHTLSIANRNNAWLHNTFVGNMNLLYDTLKNENIFSGRLQRKTEQFGKDKKQLHADTLKACFECIMRSGISHLVDLRSQLKRIDDKYYPNGAVLNDPVIVDIESGLNNMSDEFDYGFTKSVSTLWQSPDKAGELTPYALHSLFSALIRYLYNPPMRIILTRNYKDPVATLNKKASQILEAVSETTKGREKSLKYLSDLLRGMSGRNSIERA